MICYLQQELYLIVFFPMLIPSYPNSSGDLKFVFNKWISDCGGVSTAGSLFAASNYNCQFYQNTSLNSVANLLQNEKQL